MVLPPPTNSPDPMRSAARWVALGLALGAFILYVPSLSHAFINFDDYQYTIDNPYILVPSLRHLADFFTEVLQPTTVGGYYQPLTMASLMLDRVIDGVGKEMPEPFVFHLTNALLHALNGVLLFAWVRRLTGSLFGAALCAALFIAHPMNVESISWVCQRKTLLATLFALLMLLAYHRRVESGRAAWLWLAAAALLGSLLSKPTGWALPLLLIVLDAWPYRRLSMRGALEKTPLLLLSGVMGWVAYVSQLRSTGIIATSLASSPWETLLIICHNVAFYLRQVCWPFGISPQYPMPPLAQVRLSNPQFLVGVVGTFAVVAGLILLRRRRALLATVLGYLLLLGPALGTVQFMSAIAADRFVYLPMIVLALGLAAGVARLEATQPARRALVAVIGCAAVLGLSWKTWAQQAVWSNSLAYWNAAIDRYPDSPVVREGLGTAYLDRDEYDRALAEFRKAVELQPEFARGYFRMSQALNYLHRPEEALAMAERGLTISDVEREGWFNLALSYYHLRRPAEVIEPALRALESHPNWPEALFILANSLSATGRAAEAVPYFDRLVLLRPGRADYLFGAAVARIQLGADEAAFALLMRSLRIRPLDPDAAFACAAVAASTGRAEIAWQALDAAIRMDPVIIDRAERERRLAPLRSDPRWAQLRQAADQTRPLGGAGEATTKPVP